MPLLLLLKKVSGARLGESDIHPISPKTPAPQYQPIDRKKRKGKIVEDYKLNKHYLHIPMQYRRIHIPYRTVKENTHSIPNNKKIVQTL